MPASKVHDVKQVLDRGGTVPPEQVLTDEEIGKQAGNYVLSFPYPELDPEGMYTRIQKVLGVLRPESDISKLKVEPAVTVPLIQTLKRSETMAHELRTRLIWGLYQNTNWSIQDPGGRIIYGSRTLPDANVEILVIDRLEQARQSDTQSFSSEPSMIPPPPSFWVRFQQTQLYQTWYPIYRGVCILYVIWLCIVLIPKPLPPRGEGAMTIAIEIIRRVFLLVLAYFFAPIVFLIRFLSTYKFVLRSTLAKNPLLGMR